MIDEVCQERAKYVMEPREKRQKWRQSRRKHREFEQVYSARPKEKDVTAKKNETYEDNECDKIIRKRI